MRTFVALLLLIPFTFAQAKDPESTYELAHTPSITDGIPNIVVGPVKGPVRTSTKEGGPKRFIILAGRWKSFADFPGASLIAPNASLRLSPLGDFRFTIPIDKETSVPFQLRVVDSFGKSYSEEYSLRITDPSSQKKGSSSKSSTSWNIAPSLGITNLQYKETGAVSDYQSTMLTGKIGIVYTSSKRMNHSINMFSNLTALSTNLPNVSAKFFGLNLRSAYRFCPDCSWQKSIAFGLYYLRMNVTDNLFGFSNMIGPQIYGLLRKSFSPTANLVFYVKYSPVTGAGSPLSFANNEKAVGMSWNRKLGSKWWSLGLDLSTFKLRVLDVDIEAKTTSLSLGMLF